jgi:ATP-dependent Lhr-like helicase
MRVYLEGDEFGADASFIDQLQPELLQAIALTELLLQKPKWLEPPAIDEFDLSTFVQQILSVVAETGGIIADRLFAQLVSRGAFRRFDRTLFVKVLRGIAEHDLIEQAPDGTLILGLVGEQVVRRFDFYSAFLTQVDYSVVYDARRIGELPSTAVPRVADHFLLAGRRWTVVAVDNRRREVVVQPAHGRKPPRFTGTAAGVHSVVRQKMRDVLLDGQDYHYLNQAAAQWLADARAKAATAGLRTHAIVDVGDKKSLWLTWTGTRAHLTLALIAQHLDLPASDLRLALEFPKPAAEVRHRFVEVLDNMPTAISLAARVPAKQLRKFDQYVPEDLLVQGLAESALDLDEATSVIRTLVG